GLHLVLQLRPELTDLCLVITTRSMTERRTESASGAPDHRAAGYTPGSEPAGHWGKLIGPYLESRQLTSALPFTSLRTGTEPTPRQGVHCPSCHQRANGGCAASCSLSSSGSSTRPMRAAR